NVVSRLRAIWPNDAETPLGLNEERTGNSAVLYTPTVGRSTQTLGGRELILERDGSGPWLPLRAGQTYSAGVLDIRESGTTRLGRDTIILSLGPALLTNLPKLTPGLALKVSTATVPDLNGVKT